MDLHLPDLDDAFYSRFRVTGSLVGTLISNLLLVLGILIFCVVSCSPGKHPPEENLRQVGANPTQTNVYKEKIASTPTKSIINATQKVTVLRQGVFVANEGSDLPLPTSGHEIYLLGEQIHGIHEVHMLMLVYLKILHESIGLRDVVLENGRGYEGEVNQYVLNLRSDTSLYWYTGWEDILEGIKYYNQDLPDGEKIRLHLVDIHGQLSTIHAYMEDLKNWIGPSAGEIDIPDLSTFEGLYENDLLAILDQFDEIQGVQASFYSDLETLRTSIKYHFIIGQVNRGEVPMSEAVKIRDECVASNVLYVLNSLNMAPLLALYGGWHTQKSPLIRAAVKENQIVPIDAEPWAQILANNGVDIFSLLVGGINGRAHPHLIIDVKSDPNEIRFPNGSTLAELLAESPDYEVVYIDLHADANKLTRIGEHFEIWNIYDGEIPAGEAFVGMILFKEVIPTVWRFYVDLRTQDFEPHERKII